MKEIFDDKEPTARFSVDPQGAYLTRLEDNQGDPILFERQRLGENQKTRGGSHVCFPQFGPDISGALPQHGYGRDLEWEVVTQADGRTVLGLSELDLGVMLTYEAGEASLGMTLEVSNQGDHAQRISPGFHPYFAHDGTAILDGEVLDLAALGEARYIDGPAHVLIVGRHELKLHSDELTTWAVWTDQLGQYICVEPTFAGPSFSHDTLSPDSEMLLPDEDRRYGFTISW